MVGLVPGAAVCLFAQYAPTGTLPAPTRRYLQCLADLGLRLEVAMAGIETPHPADAAFIAALGGRILARPNRGHDFGAWADLLRAGRLGAAQTVLLANDSVFGPYGPLAPLWSDMAARPLDGWGLVESHQRGWHLQSWFLVLNAALLARPALCRIFAQDFASMTKPEIILHGELGLSVALLAEGARLASAFGPEPRRRRLLPANPSHFDWASLLRSGRAPFLKRELLRDNPADLAWLAPSWRAVLAGLPGAGVAEIESALGPFFTPPCRGQSLTRRLFDCLQTRDHTLALTALLPRGPRPRPDAARAPQAVPPTVSPPTSRLG